jgi:hypothetical protein
MWFLYEWLKCIYCGTAKAGTITMPMLCHDDPVERSVPSSTSSRHGRHKTNTSYCSSGSSRLGSGDSENGAIKRPKPRVLSTGGRNQSATGIEIYRRPQPHVQKLLGSVEVARYEKRQTRAQLGIRQRTIYNNPNSYPSEQSKGRADRTT